MARKKSWDYAPITSGVATVTLNNWAYFDDYIRKELLNYKTYIFRGHANHNWKLESSLDRMFKRRRRSFSGLDRAQHLDAFTQAARGRRGMNPPTLNDPNDWWSLGQHFGLATPLLDFSDAPFVALYFAFIEELEGNPEYRAVWAVSEGDIKRKSEDLTIKYHNEMETWKKIGGPTSGTGLSDNTALAELGSLLNPAGTTQVSPATQKPHYPALAQIVRPMSNENPRLVSQGGLFVRVPDGMALEDWVQKHFNDEQKQYIVLKIRIPNRERNKILIALNRMNINHLSLFPDLFGASFYCNTALQIRSY